MKHRVEAAFRGRAARHAIKVATSDSRDFGELHYRAPEGHVVAVPWSDLNRKRQCRAPLAPFSGYLGQTKLLRLVLVRYPGAGLALRGRLRATSSSSQDARRRRAAQSKVDELDLVARRRRRLRSRRRCVRSRERTPSCIRHTSLLAYEHLQHPLSKCSHESWPR